MGPLYSEGSLPDKDALYILTISILAWSETKTYISFSPAFARRPSRFTRVIGNLNLNELHSIKFYYKIFMYVIYKPAFPGTHLRYCILPSRE
jgi:hypothetical protein